LSAVPVSLVRIAMISTSFSAMTPPRALLATARPGLLHSRYVSARTFLLRADGPDPVLVLDDVFAELDRHRREALMEIAQQAEQVLITSAVGEELPQALVEDSSVTHHTVTVAQTEQGRISLLDEKPVAEE